MRLLLVEDDGMVGESVRTGLRREGFTVDWVKDGVAAELAAASDDYALILLDLGLPRKDGIDVLKALRRKGNHVPILILTARDAVPDRVLGLNSGADDYLVKPFDLHELFARVHALLRRQAGRADPLVTFADVVLNPITHQVTRGGRDIDLSATEFALLEALLSGRERSSRAASSSSGSTAGTRKWKAIRSRCTCPDYARRSAPTSSARCVGWVTAW